MQKFQPAFIRLQSESLEPYSTYNSRIRDSMIKPNYYESKHSEDFIANTHNFVDSMIMENEYFSTQIRQKNATIKLKTRRTSKVPKQDIIKRNIYMVSRLTKTQNALEEKSKQNKDRKIANEPKPDMFAPMLNKKSLVIASKRRDIKIKESRLRESFNSKDECKLRRSEPSVESFEDVKNRSFFYYDKSKKTINCLSLSKPKNQVYRKNVDQSSSGSRKSKNLFKPTINKKSKILVEKMGYDKKDREKELSELHKQRIRFRRESGNALKEQKEEDEFKECSFKPKINRSSSITFNSKVENRLLHWDNNRKHKLEFLNAELLEKEARLATKALKPKIKDDLSYISRESVQKSISKFLYRKDYSNKKEKEKNDLKAKFCLLRSNL